MFDQTFESFPSQIEPVEARVPALQRRHHAQSLRVVVKAAEGGKTFVERPLAGMSKRRMTEVMGESQRLSQVLVETKRAGERARHLRDFQRVGEPRAVVVAFIEHKDLSLVLEAAKGGRVDDAIAIATKGAPPLARRLRM